MSFLKGGSSRSVKPAIWNNVLSLGSLRLNKLHSSLNYTVILNIVLYPDSLRLKELHSSINYIVILNIVLYPDSLRLNKLHSSLNCNDGNFFLDFSSKCIDILLIFWYYGNCRIALSATLKNIYNVQGKIKLPSKRKFNLEKGNWFFL